MIFNETVSFEITVNGANSDVKRLVSTLLSGEFDDFFEIEEDMLSFDDDYETGEPDDQTSMLFSSDEFGVEVDEFDTDEFLEMFCKAAKRLYVNGVFYNFDDEEYRFVSETGDSYYVNSDSISHFNDELDEERSREEREAAEDDED